MRKRRVVRGATRQHAESARAALHSTAVRGKLRRQDAERGGAIASRDAWTQQHARRVAERVRGKATEVLFRKKRRLIRTPLLLLHALPPELGVGRERISKWHVAVISHLTKRHCRGGQKQGR